MLLDLLGVESVEPDRQSQHADTQQQGRREANGGSQNRQARRHDQQNDDPSPNPDVEATWVSLVPCDRGADQGKDDPCEGEGHCGTAELEEPDQDSQGQAPAKKLTSFHKTPF